MGLTGLQLLTAARAAAQLLPESGKPYYVSVPFNVYSRPDSASRVLGFIRPSQTVIAVRTMRGGWTEIRWPEATRSIGFAHVTRPVPPLGLTDPGSAVGRSGSGVPQPSSDAVRVWWKWVLGGGSGLVILWWGARRLLDRVPHDVLAVQVKWRDPSDPRSALGPDVADQLDGALRRYKRGEAGALQSARGVIVTTAGMGEAGGQAAAGHGIECVVLSADLDPEIAALPPGKDRNRAVGRWYEDVVADWYEGQGYSVDRRYHRLGPADNGIDILCWRR